MLSTDLQREATEAAVEANGQVRGQHPRGRGRGPGAAHCFGQVKIWIVTANVNEISL